MCPKEFFTYHFKSWGSENFLVVHWLGLSDYTAEGKMCGPSKKKKKIVLKKALRFTLKIPQQKMSFVQGLECLILLRCSYYPKRSVDSTVCQNTSFVEIGKCILKRIRNLKGSQVAQTFFVVVVFGLSLAWAHSSENVDPLDHQGIPCQNNFEKERSV